ncbi:LuxR C-terminal-related transcriptional regulator [Streptomyces sp. NPDC018000]|uniref:LuxR C-terminal-related transcriptional regulator n=1 Tax=Streptomyces sp. NPDC018000 TaxID=3365028 RepID=UPI00378950EB
MPQVSRRISVRPAPDRMSGADRTTTLLLGDEQPLIRQGVRAVFDGDPAFRIQGEASDGDALLELARRHRPDAVLMDTALPGPDIIDTVHCLVTDHPGNIAVTLLTSERDLTDGWVLSAVRAGVRGFLFKWGEPEEILSCVREVTSGGFAMSADIISQILRALHCPYGPTAPRPRGDISLLTPREMQVFLLVAQGLTNQQISGTLILSDATVKTHFHRVCRKLALRNRVDAVILAYELGIAGSRNVHHSVGPRAKTTEIIKAALHSQPTADEHGEMTMSPA